MALRQAVEPTPLAADVDLGAATGRARPSPWRVFLANPAAKAGAIYLGLVVALAVAIPWLSPHDPLKTNPAIRLTAPNQTNLMGTDQLGRDVLTRAVYAARTSLPIGVTVMILSTVLGAFIGILAGYFPRFDGPSMRIIDGFMAFPGILLAIALVSALGANVVTLIAAITVVSIPIMARLTRGVTLTTKHLAFVEAARAVGASNVVILWRHILPSSLPILIIHSTFGISEAILAEAALSFLGTGIPPSIPTWGTMLHEGQAQLARAWWLAITPGVALVSTVLALNLVGDGLRDALDPRLASR